MYSLNFFKKKFKQKGEMRVTKGTGLSFWSDEMFSIDCGNDWTLLNILKTLNVYF